MVKLEGVNQSAGKARVDLSIRIHGTDDLDDPKMRTYSCEATPDSVSTDVDSASRHGG